MPLSLALALGVGIDFHVDVGIDVDIDVGIDVGIGFRNQYRSWTFAIHPSECAGHYTTYLGRLCEARGPCSNNLSWQKPSGVMAAWDQIVGIEGAVSAWSVGAADAEQAHSFIR